MLDIYGCGYPDLSYHGDEAWKAQTESYNRHIGIMYCAKSDDGNEYIYIAYNMHWDTHRFALPSIGNCEWKAVIGTENNEVIVDKELKSDYIDIKPRSITILVGSKSQSTEEDKTPKTEKTTKRRKNSKDKQNNKNNENKPVQKRKYRKRVKKGADLETLQNNNTPQNDGDDRVL
jgi:glycogen operon protein